MAVTDALKPRFDGTLNFGHIMTAVSLVITVGGLGAYQIQQNAARDIQIAALHRDVSDIKTVQIPRIAAIEATNSLNAERITNAANSSRSLREEFSSTANELRRVDTDLYVQIGEAKIAIASMTGVRTK